MHFKSSNRVSVNLITKFIHPYIYIYHYVYAQVVDKWGKLDVMVLNAAYQPIINSITETSEGEVEKTFKTNIFPQFYLVSCFECILQHSVVIVVSHYTLFLK